MNYVKRTRMRVFGNFETGLGYSVGSPDLCLTRATSSKYSSKSPRKLSSGSAMATSMICSQVGVCHRQALVAGCKLVSRPALPCRRRSLAVRVANIAAPMAPPTAPPARVEVPVVDEVRLTGVWCRQQNSPPRRFGPACHPLRPAFSLRGL